jgi:hypothetical protein
LLLILGANGGMLMGQRPEPGQKPSGGKVAPPASASITKPESGAIRTPLISRSQWLTTAATVAAAIAAAFSAYAAFRQENAAYQSQLYNKQVDTISTLIQTTENTSHRISDLYQAFHPVDGTAVTLDVKQRLQQESVDIFSRFSLAKQAAKLVVPSTIGQALGSLEMAEASFMQVALNSKIAGDQKAMAGELRSHIADVETQSTILQICASEELSLGHVLRSQEFLACLNRQPQR